LTDNRQRDRIFYGWYIVAASFGILFFNSGARYAFGVMMKPIIAEFGWSRGAGFMTGSAPGGSSLSPRSLLRRDLP
jgi:OFA family oxalate/formate antiporter-like MFS transporter